jgi:hypothetical protein
MSDQVEALERLLGQATFRLWPDLPRDIQEKLFESAVPRDEIIRRNLAVLFHERHPRTLHPPKPTPAPQKA